MKKQICMVAFSGLLTLGMSAGIAVAQDSMQQGGSMQGQGSGGHHGMSSDEMLAHMTKRYKLTADQQGQIKPILDAQHQSMEQMHADNSMSRDDKMAKMQSMRADTHQKIEAVLTAEQKTKFEADEAKMQQHRMDHGGAGGQGGDAPPPPQ